MTKVVWLPNETDYSYCEFVVPNTPYGRGRKDRTYPQQCCRVEGPKSVYNPDFSDNHWAKSWLPRNGLDASLSSRATTSAPKIRIKYSAALHVHLVSDNIRAVN